jgi:lipoprotein-anchoring transpeptidase ErfK/SrfK
MECVTGGARVNQMFRGFLFLLCISIAPAHSLVAQSSTQLGVQISSATDVKFHQRLVLVSIADRKLAVIEDGVVIARFSVAVGAEITPSPVGEFQIVTRVVNPTYYHPGSVIPSGKDNPIGTRWVGLSQKGYGIHGTNAPRSVGHAASHGCIRLRNREMEKLFELIHTGDEVQIRSERDEQIAQVFGDAADDATVADARSQQPEWGNRQEIDKR